MGLRNIILSGLFGLAGLCAPMSAEADDPIYRDNLYVSAALSNVNINGKMYEAGATAGLTGSIIAPVSDWLSFNPKFNASYSSYGLVGKNSTEELRYVDASLDSRLKVGFGYLTLGGEYMLNDEIMTFDGKEGYMKNRGMGPSIGFCIEYPHIDASISVSELFGYKLTIYDQKRLTRTQHLTLSLIPRSGDIELRTSFELFHSAIAEIPTDRDDFLLKFTFQPSIDITPHVSLFPFITQARSYGSDEYITTEFGLGSRIKW